jgi:tungstate transport system substrate-binding protein
MCCLGDVIAAVKRVESRFAPRPLWFYNKIMFNDFILVGPPDDPAGVKRARTVERAMRAIADAGVRFISRGDSSGTHERERELWSRAGVMPDSGRVVVAGAGMGATLRIAATTRAYTLTDRATFAQYASRGDLKIVFEGGPDLVNTYAVIAARDAHADVRRFTEWLTDGDGRRLIAGYRTTAGTVAFVIWPAGCPRESPAALPCARE